MTIVTSGPRPMEWGKRRFIPFHKLCDVRGEIIFFSIKKLHHMVYLHFWEVAAMLRYCCAVDCDHGSLDVSTENGEVSCTCYHWSRQRQRQRQRQISRRDLYEVTCTCYHWYQDASMRFSEFNYSLILDQRWNKDAIIQLQYGTFQKLWFFCLFFAKRK